MEKTLVEELKVREKKKADLEVVKALREEFSLPVDKFKEDGIEIERRIHFAPDQKDLGSILFYLFKEGKEYYDFTLFHVESIEETKAKGYKVTEEMLTMLAEGELGDVVTLIFQDYITHHFMHLDNGTVVYTGEKLWEE